MKSIIKRVLLVEDEFVSQKSEKALLESSGFVVDVASNGTEGLDLFHYRAQQPFRKAYDAIFVDIMLPDINGDVLTEVIRHTEEMAKFIPIIAVTGQVLSDKDRDNFAKMGITDIIVKPMTKEILDSIIEKYKFFA